MKHWAFSIFLFTLAGCIVVPNLSSEPFVPEKGEFTIGKTTRAQILQKLDEPVYESEHELHFYDSELRLFLIGFPDYSAEITKQYYLVLRFDESGLLNELEWLKEPYSGATGPYVWSLEPLAHAFSIQPEDFTFVSAALSETPHDPASKCEKKPRKRPTFKRGKIACPSRPIRHYGISVLTPNFIGFAHWAENRYEILWQVNHSAMENTDTPVCGKNSCQLKFLPLSADASTQVCNIRFFKDDRSEQKTEQKVQEFSRLLAEVYRP